MEKWGSIHSTTGTIEPRNGSDSRKGIPAGVPYGASTCQYPERAALGSTHFCHAQRGRLCRKPRGVSLLAHGAAAGTITGWNLYHQVGRCCIQQNPNTLCPKKQLEALQNKLRFYAKPSLLIKRSAIDPKPSPQFQPHRLSSSKRLIYGVKD